MKKSGFTLIELLIVVAIIGILAAIAVPNFLNAQIRAKVVQTESNMRALETAMGMYMADHNSYPPMFAYGGTFNAYGGYSALTTPVPYLDAFSATKDPFRDRQKERLAAVSDNTSDQQFEYTPRKKGQAAAVPALSGFPADMYFIEGVGPDTIDSIPGTPNYPDPPSSFIPYDTSNGLFSQGDIYRAGGVFIPDWVKADKAF